MSRWVATRIVKVAAEEEATAWLQHHGYCDCAGQVQIVARRLVPVVAMFEREYRLGGMDNKQGVGHRLDIYFRAAEHDLAKGLHRPGASAAAAAHPHDPNGNGRLS